MKESFDPIKGKAANIIECIMTAPEMPADDGLQFKIRLCVEEAVVNVVSYAYVDGQGSIEVSTEVDPEGMLVILLRDSGVPFNPLDKPDPDITLSAQDRAIGGLGIYLCKQLMDSVEYEYTDGCNNLTMKIKIN